MTLIQKYIFGIAALLMSLALKLPIWRIDIWAPQYPEGLSLHIFANRIGGNVTSINILNHYIGMKHIIPDQIPELSLIPWALGIVVAFGILVVFSNRIFFAKIWLVLLGIISLGGLIDFYRWGYNYGHNLNPDAPIKIMGLSYQPPLLGFKQILNIEVYSLPDWGACALGLGIVLVFWGIFGESILEYTKSYRTYAWEKLFNLKRANLILLLLIPFMLNSCTSKKPEPLKIGDECENCHMSITDVHFGAELITKKGRHIKFDSIHCLKDYLSKNAADAKDIFVSDYIRQDSLVNVSEAYFLSHSSIHGPMGADIIASRDKSALEKIKTQSSGKVTTWKGLSQSSL